MRKKLRTQLDGRPLGQISFGVPDRISEGSKGQVAGRKNSERPTKKSLDAAHASFWRPGKIWEAWPDALLGSGIVQK
jgi:hypothetical protein